MANSATWFKNLSVVRLKIASDTMDYCYWCGSVDILTEDVGKKWMCEGGNGGVNSLTALSY